MNENTTFSCGGSYRVADRNIGCWKLAGHGTETFAQGLSNSCNPVFMQLGEKIGATTFFRYFEAFGLTRKTGIDLIGESNSIYYDADGLGPTELATSSFGQSFRVTPIQMITAAAAVANGGYLVQPHVVSQILDSEGNIVETVETEVKRQVHLRGHERPRERHAAGDGDHRHSQERLCGWIPHCRQDGYL